MKRGFSLGRRGAALALLGPPLALFLAFFVAPLASLFWASLHGASQTALYGDELTLANYAAILEDPFYHTIILRTLVTGGDDRRRHPGARLRDSLRDRAAAAANAAAPAPSPPRAADGQQRHPRLWLDRDPRPAGPRQHRPARYRHHRPAAAHVEHLRGGGRRPHDHPVALHGDLDRERARRHRRAIIATRRSRSGRRRSAPSSTSPGRCRAPASPRASCSSSF